MPAEFYLRFRADNGTGAMWLRRGLFALAYYRVKLQQLASPFPSSAEAAAFAQNFKLSGAVEVVSISAEAVNRG